MSTPTHREALLALFTVAKKQTSCHSLVYEELMDLMRALAGASAALAAPDEHAPTLDEHARFEAWVRARYFCTEHSFIRSAGGYAHSVGHNAMHSTYASVQMLWETWRGREASKPPLFSEEQLRSIIEQECGPVQKMGDMLWAVEVVHAVLRRIKA
jgi:hypothetical protein